MLIIELYYCKDENYFIDEDGNIIYDIFSYITPNELLFFKMSDMDLLIDKNDHMVELIHDDSFVEIINGKETISQYPREPKYIISGSVA